jgi:hypothetical protein
LEISLQDTPLQQVQACAEIGIMCIDPNPENRPIIQHIIKRFMELGSTEEFVQAGESSSAAQASSLPLINFESLCTFNFHSLAVGFDT